MAQGRVTVFANKWWEADPLCAVLLNDYARPREFSNFKFLHYPTQRPYRVGDPRPPDPSITPRFTFECAGAEVEIWCIEELINPADNSSSSLLKSGVLSKALGLG